MNSKRISNTLVLALMLIALYLTVIQTVSVTTAYGITPTVPTVTELTITSSKPLIKNTEYQVSWDSVVVDESLIWNSTTPDKIYVKSPGLYHVRGIFAMTSRGQNAPRSRFHTGVVVETLPFTYNTGDADLTNQPSLWLEPEWEYVITDPSRQFIRAVVKSNDDNTQIAQARLEIIKERDDS